MTPDRAAELMRALLMTPDFELNVFARRNGLPEPVDPNDLAMAKELLVAIQVGLRSTQGPNWSRVETAWGAMRAKHGALRDDELAPAPPGWVRASLPPKPSLSDPAASSSSSSRGAPGGAYAAPPPAYPRATAPTPGYQPASGGLTPPPATPMATTAGPTSPATSPPASPSASPPPSRPEPAVSAPRPAPPNIADDVDLYAAFCAACAAAPEKVFATMVQYGIGSPEMRGQLDEMWQERFDDDAALQRRWEQVYRHYRNHGLS
ncbi:MAG: hypothetical protein AAGN82_15290 [Myxococcota bacterium]